MRETLEQAGYQLHSHNRFGEYTLLNLETGKLELWFHNQGHASYGVVYKGKDLEFAREIND